MFLLSRRKIKQLETQDRNKKLYEKATAHTHVAESWPTVRAQNILPDLKARNTSHHVTQI